MYLPGSSVHSTKKKTKAITHHVTSGMHWPSELEICGGASALGALVLGESYGLAACLFGSFIVKGCHLVLWAGGLSPGGWLFGGLTSASAGVYGEYLTLSKVVWCMHAAQSVVWFYGTWVLHLFSLVAVIYIIDC